MRRLLLSFLFLFVIAAPVGAQDTETVRIADSAVFRILNVGAKSIGTGTGYLVNEDGYLLTNNHVISGAKEVLVLRSDIGGNKGVKARVIHVNRSLDMAILHAPKITGGVLSFRQGEPEKGIEVFALGFPGIADTHEAKSLDEFIQILRYDQNYTTSTHTNGIVSRTVRSNWERGGVDLSIIQHTAAIRPGNSGGPLLDICGVVVGMNTQFKSDEVTANVHLASASSEILKFAQGAGVSVDVDTDDCQTTPASPQSDWMLIAVVGAVVVVGCAAIAFFLMRSRKIRSLSEGRDDLSRRLRDLESGPAPAPRKDPGAGPKTWRFKVRTDEGKVGIRFSSADLKSGLIIGRDDDATFTLPQSTISRRHAIIRKAPGGISISDLGSTNGTSVNGEPLASKEERRLNSGDRIKLGGLEGLLETED